MDTPITMTVVGATDRAEAAAERAFGWFRRIEERCSRFDEQSEVMQLTARIGVPSEVSELLFEVTRFALEVAAASDGAFDPTVGHLLERRGFNRNYRTGQVVQSSIPTSDQCSYRDVCLDPQRRTITLRRPLILDLGAVAKGFAIDLAARELAGFAGFSVDAGGDLLVRGRNPDGANWRVGIRHPRRPGELVETVTLTNAAICTSGDYERPAPGAADGHHIVDPRTGASTDSIASVTVIAPSAMLADALGTAAFVLGPADGLDLLERQGVDGLIFSSSLERYATRRFARYHR